MNLRAISAVTLVQVIFEQRHLNEALKESHLSPLDKSLAQEICYGVCRGYYQLDFILKKLLQKPLKDKDNDIYCLLLIGLYQLIYLRVPSHAAVNETVNAALSLKKVWAKNLLNAILRNFLRQKEQLTVIDPKNEEAYYSHPKWFIERIKCSWPSAWQTILTNNNVKSQMSLRVNLLKTTQDVYLQALTQQNINAEASMTPCGIDLKEPVNVDKLPGFHEGLVTVQDTAAQLAAILLDPKENDRILDACAAPGGKSTHILEFQPNLKQLVAIDFGEDRIKKLKESFARLKMKAEIINADANEVDSWWDKQLFDRILLDAPCSATGVIRRHPDIKIHRQMKDIQQLSELQLNILNSLWKVLKPGGVLLYVTCSILPEENGDVITSFLKNHSDARELTLELSFGIKQEKGQQILPNEKMDGFYYAKLQKM